MSYMSFSKAKVFIATITSFKNPTTGACRPNLADTELYLKKA